MKSDVLLRQVKDKHKKTTRRSITNSYIAIAGIIIILIGICYFVLDSVNGFSLVDFGKDIIGNLMGVLAAFLIFDLIHDKMSKDSYADEVSEQILDTLLEQGGIEALDESIKRKFIYSSITSINHDKEAEKGIANALDSYLSGCTEAKIVLDRIQMFSERQKNKFVLDNIKSIVEDPDATSLVTNFLSNYLKSNIECKITTSLQNNFVLRDRLTDAFSILKNTDNYFLVDETLTYRVKYLSDSANDVNNNILRMGFAFNNTALDKFLRDQQIDQAGNPLSNCFFRESLDIDKEDMEIFLNMQAEELKNSFDNMFRPHLTIDGKEGVLTSVTASSCGLIAEFSVGHDTSAHEHNIDIAFMMPKRWYSVIEAVFVDPTKNPRIAINYESDSMHVEMYSFLDIGDNSSYEKSHIEDIGMYRIILDDSWVYPVSGVVFTIEPNNTRNERSNDNG